MGLNVALSFSGGKDSCLALYQLQQQGIDVVCLLTTIWKDSLQTVAHDEALELIEGQAKRLNIPVHFVETDFSTYREDFVNALHNVKENFRIDGIAFGDIYLQGHREWGEAVADSAGLQALYPLWTAQENAAAMLHHFVALGFSAKVIKVDETKLPTCWIGRLLDMELIGAILTKDVCPMGESGEYHTHVYDGPIFNKSN